MYHRLGEKRKGEIEKALNEQGVMTEELQEKLNKAVTLAELEDIYRPFKPKRRTRATIAKEKGLEPLALWLLMQLPGGNVQQEAEKYVNEEKDVPDAESALAGARDIIAESVSDFADRLLLLVVEQKNTFTQPDASVGGFDLSIFSAPIFAA